MSIRAMYVAVLTSTLLLGACGGGSGGAEPGQSDGNGQLTPRGFGVSSTTPADGATGVERDAILSAAFNRDIFAASVTEDDDNVLLSRGGDGEAVPITVSVDTARSLSIQPDAPLALLTNYTATATTDITDTEGNPLEEDYRWGFTTRDGSWGDAALLEDAPEDTRHADVAVDAGGDALAVWVQSDETTGFDDVYARFYSADTETWEPVIELQHTPDSGNSYDNASDPDVAFDGTGNAIVVWHRREGNTYKIYARRRSAEGGWGAVEQVSTDRDDPVTYPRIEFDADGNAMVAWINMTYEDGELDTLAYNRYDAVTGWEGPQSGESLADAGLFSYQHDLAVDATGNAIVLWVKEEPAILNLESRVYATRYDAAARTWSNPTAIETHNVEGEASVPDIAFDGHGNAFAAWYRFTRTGERFERVYVNRYDAGTGGWSRAATWIKGARDYDCGRFPTVAADHEGSALVVFGCGEAYSSRYAAESGSWSSAEQIAAYSGAVDAELAMDRSGNAIAIWKKTDGTADNIYAARYAAAAARWDDAELIEVGGSGEALAPRIAVDGDGRAIAVWQDAQSTYFNRFSAE